MKILSITMTAVLMALATQAQANLTPIFVDRSVLVSGGAIPSDYFLQVESRGIDPFLYRVEGSYLGASSSASQTSTIGADGFALSVDLFAQNIGQMQANASAFFGIGFTLSERSGIILAGAGNFLGDPPDDTPDYGLFFGTRFTNQQPFFGFSTFDLGVEQPFLLDAGDYVFHTQYSLSALPGQSRGIHADLTLRTIPVATVPEAEGTLLLLGLGFLAIVGAHRSTEPPQKKRAILTGQPPIRV